jgi:hypothetical protein
VETENVQVVRESPIRLTITTGKIFEAIAAAQLELAPAVKDAKNPDKGNRYASLTSVIEAAKPYSRHGVAILQPATTNGSTATVTTILAFGAERIEWEIDMLAMRIVKGGAREIMLDPQSIASAITYGRRYALTSALLIPQDDDDGEKAHRAAAAAKAEAEAADLLELDDVPVAPPAPVKSAKEKREEAKAHQAEVAAKRIAEETAKLEALKNAEPADDAPITMEQRFMAATDKFARLRIFEQLKADLKEILGDDEGEAVYYDILAGAGVKHSNEFKSLKIAAGVAEILEARIKRAVGAPAPAADRDDWLPPGMGDKAA